MKPPMQIVEAFALQNKDPAEKCWTGVLNLGTLKKMKPEGEEIRVVLFEAKQIPAFLNGAGGKTTVAEDTLYMAVEIPAPTPKAKPKSAL